MGPPPFGGGNLTGRAGQVPDARSFNGATAFRRWKLRSSTLRTASTGSFNGATAFRRWKSRWIFASPESACMLQWGHRLSAVEISSDARIPKHRDTASMGPPPFGGGNEKEGDGLLVRTEASMGPPPFGGGNNRQFRTVNLLHPRFNGATAFRRWKWVGGC